MGTDNSRLSHLKSRMDENFFWELVEASGWGGSEQLTATVFKVRLLRSLSFSELKDFSDIFYKKITDVRRRTLNYQENNKTELFSHVGDSFDDFCSNVVGRGREAFDRFMSDDDEVKAVYDGGWKESFSYYIPAPTETELLSGKYYTEKAYRYLVELENQYNEEKASEKKWSPQKRAAITEGKEPSYFIGIVMEVMNFVRNYQFRDAISSLDQVVLAMEELQKMGVSLSCHHGPKNLITDMVNYYKG